MKRQNSKAVQLNQEIQNKVTKIDEYIQEAQYLNLNECKNRFDELKGKYSRINTSQAGAAANFGRYNSDQFNPLVMYYNEEKNKKLDLYLSVLGQIEQNNLSNKEDIESKKNLVDGAKANMVQGLDNSIRQFLIGSLSGELKKLGDNYNSCIKFVGNNCEDALKEEHGKLYLDLNLFKTNVDKANQNIANLSQDSSWHDKHVRSIGLIVKLRGSSVELLESTMAFVIKNKAQGQLRKIADLNSKIEAAKDTIVVCKDQNGFVGYWQNMEKKLDDIKTAVLSAQNQKDYNKANSILKTNAESINKIDAAFRKQYGDQQTFIATWHNKKSMDLSDDYNKNLALLNNLEQANIQLDNTDYKNNYVLPEVLRNNMAEIKNSVDAINNVQNREAKLSRIGKNEIEQVNKAVENAKMVYAIISERVGVFQTDVIGVWNAALETKIQELSKEKKNLDACIEIAKISNEQRGLNGFNGRFNQIFSDNQASGLLTLQHAVLNLKLKQQEQEKLQMEFSLIERAVNASIIEQFNQSKTECDKSLADINSKLDKTPEWFKNDFLMESNEIARKLNALQSPSAGERLDASVLKDYDNQLQKSEQYSGALDKAIDEAAKAKVSEFDNAITNLMNQVAGKVQISLNELNEAVTQTQSLKNKLSVQGVSEVFKIADKKIENTQKSLAGVQVIILGKIKANADERLSQIELIRSNFEKLKEISSKLQQHEERNELVLQNEEQQLKTMNASAEPTIQQIVTLQSVEVAIGEKKMEIEGKIRKINSAAKAYENKLIKQKNELEASIKVEKDFCKGLYVQRRLNKSPELESISDRCSKMQINGKNGRKQRVDIDKLKEKAEMLAAAKTTIDTLTNKLNSLKTGSQEIAKQKIRELACEVLKKIQSLQKKIAPLSDVFKKEAVQNLDAMKNRANEIRVKDSEDLSKETLDKYILELNTVSAEVDEQSRKLSAEAKISADALFNACDACENKVDALAKNDNASKDEWLQISQECDTFRTMLANDETNKVYAFYDPQGQITAYNQMYSQIDALSKTINDYISQINGNNFTL